MKGTVTAMATSRSFGQRPSRPYDGLILAVKKTSAKQLVLTILTHQEGILHVLARRSTQGKMGYGALSPLAEISFDVFEKDGVHTLTEYDCRANRRLRDLTWDGYVYSQIFVEMVLFLTASGERDEELYRLVRLYGRAIEIKDVRIGTHKDVVYAETKRLLTDKAAYDAMSNAVNPYGDGQASRRIVEAILHVFAGNEAVPDDFSRSK